MNLKHLTRRNLLKSAAAGTAATLPAAAVAATGGQFDHQLPPLPPEQQVDACIEQLKSALSQLHPGCDAPRGAYLVSRHGAGTVLVTANIPRLPWSGPGFYELLWNHGKSRDVFHVERVWSDMDKCWGYWAAIIWDGYLISPCEYFGEGDLHILREVEGVVLKPNPNTLTR